MRRPFFFFTKLLISIEMIESNLQNARVIVGLYKKLFSNFVIVVFLTSVINVTNESGFFFLSYIIILFLSVNLIYVLLLQLWYIYHTHQVCKYMRYLLLLYILI